MEINAVNNTAKPDGLVPTLLVFDAYPKISNLDPPVALISQKPQQEIKRRRNLGKSTLSGK